MHSTLTVALSSMGRRGIQILKRQSDRYESLAHQIPGQYSPYPCRPGREVCCIPCTPHRLLYERVSPKTRPRTLIADSEGLRGGRRGYREVHSWNGRAGIPRSEDIRKGTCSALRRRSRSWNAPVCLIAFTSGASRFLRAGRFDPKDRDSAPESLSRRSGHPATFTCGSVTITDWRCCGYSCQHLSESVMALIGHPNRPSNRYWYKACSTKPRSEVPRWRF